MISLQTICVCVIVVSQVFLTQSQYTVPEVTLEAYTPSGFRVSIKVDAGVELFVFHGNLNKKIANTEYGEISGEVTVASTDVGDPVFFAQPQLKLKVGDVINYWVYIGRGVRGYFKGGQRWEVTELRNCTASLSRVSDGAEVCSQITIFEDNFDQANLDTDKWLWEQYIPGAPDYEFVVYKKDRNVTFITSGELQIIPSVIEDESELLSDNLDISDGCTRTGRLCKVKRFVQHNPVISGSIVSKTTFRYGEFEIRAKLPTGDWIFPRIYLEDDVNNQKLFIAYSRGNVHLVNNDGIDIGGTILFGGPVLHPTEPQRSEKLSNTSGSSPYSADFHIYKVIWKPSQIELYVDGNIYGLINTDSLRPSIFDKESTKRVHLVLGVGVGGLNNFPEKSKSGNYEKPWKNYDRSMVKTFYDKRGEWHSGTWNSNSRLQVDYVRIKSF